MRTRTLPLLFALSLFALLGAAASGDAAKEVANTIEEVRGALRALPRDTAPPSQERVIAVVRDTVLPHVDVALAGQLVMGHYWRDATPAQREAFVDAYREMLLRLYGTQAMDYLDAKVEFLPETPSQDGQRTRVPTRVEVGGKPEMKVDYQLRLRDGQWRVFDVVINGVSGVITLRQAVGEDLARYGVDGVIKRLQDKLASTATPPAP